MKSNRNIIAKAAVDTSALGNGGRMNAEQANQFITFMRDYSYDLITSPRPHLLTASLWGLGFKINILRMTQTCSL